jgi:hypothetical protein
MRKKLITACLAIAAFAAFVVAPSASAANFTENGVTLKAGASITGTAGETKFTAGSNTVICSTADMSGTVKVDENGTILGEIAAGNPVFTGTGTGADCTSEGLGPVKPTVNSKLCLHIPKGTDIGTVDGCKVKTIVEGVEKEVTEPITFTLFATNLGLECHYSISSLNAEITTAPADAQVKVIPGQKVPRESNFLCPLEGELDMEFTLTTTDGTTLTFS